ncbi:MAG: cysteine--tRNA ligase [Nitrosomonadales bacterium]|nr:cysteine--tRNA ligase [Nitrosomonadales bacterium]
MLKIYNTLARDKQDFKPITLNSVRMYVCGMTVYDYCHLGHARVMVVFDMVYRWLKASGYDVTYVRNITDIDDKIIKRAAENKESIHALTARFIAAMHEDADALGVQHPDHEPRATQYVAEMLEMIAQLEKNGLAYRAADGDVNYAVRKFAGYGKLSGKSLEDLRAGERVDIAGNKNDPLDFVLWKHAKEQEADEVKWDSPWGKGRPGWHIECSAMGSEILGKHFDIHGGGADLQFPHHENEIAQSEGAQLHEKGSRGQYVNYWMHNGFVRVDEEKMSKSLGNFFTIREVLKKYDAEVVRFFILRAHYRSPLNYSDVHLDDAKKALERLYTALKSITPPGLPLSGEETGSPPDETTSHSTKTSKNDVQVAGYDKWRLGGVVVDWNEPYAQRFKTAMDDDFNTPEAVAVLFDLANEVNRTQSAQAAAQLKALGAVLGLLQRDPQAFLQRGAGGLDDAAIGAQIEARLAAKKARNFAEADRIRKELLEAGIVLEDTPQGTSWRRA